jgi:hypothetical protein
MLKYSADSKQLETISSTTLKEANILERSGLQEAIVNSWEDFCGELGFEELFFVGSEVTPHNSCDNRIDILALSREGTPFVIELKRHRNRLQLLQALSYAAMISKWDQSRYLEELRGMEGEQADELRSLLAEDGFELGTPEVVMIAESFDPEVILSSDWLADFGVAISAFAITSATQDGETIIAVDQKFPLLGLDDVYVRRTGQRRASGETTTWDEALKKVDFPFSRRAVRVFTRKIQGSPHRRAFFSIYSSSPLGRLRINFRRNYLKIYTREQTPEAETVLQQRLGDLIPFKSWGNESTNNKGFTFTIETEEQFEKFLEAVGDTEDQ